MAKKRENNKISDIMAEYHIKNMHHGHLSEFILWEGCKVLRSTCQYVSALAISKTTCPNFTNFLYILPVATA